MHVFRSKLERIYGAERAGVWQKLQKTLLKAENLKNTTIMETKVTTRLNVFENRAVPFAIFSVQRVLHTDILH